MGIYVLSFHIMKLAIVLTSTDAEKNWNALRLANIAVQEDDQVSIFLIAGGVEYMKYSTEKFNIQEQIDKFLGSKNTEILACETCMVIRHQKSDKACPVSGIKELYGLIKKSDKIITF